MAESSDLANDNEKPTEINASDSTLNQQEEQELLAMVDSETHEHAEKEDGDEQNEENLYKDDENGENGDKEDNEFVVWADDTEEMEEDKRRAEEATDTPKVKKDFGIEMSKESDELLVTWHGKELRVPCKEEVSRDIRYYCRQLFLIAHPITFTDLDDPALKHCLQKASNVAMEVTEVHDGPPVKGYLRMKFNSLADAVEVRGALEALPPFPKKEVSVTEAVAADEGGVGTVSDGGVEGSDNAAKVEGAAEKDVKEEEGGKEKAAVSAKVESGNEVKMAEGGGEKKEDGVVVKEEVKAEDGSGDGKKEDTRTEEEKKEEEAAKANKRNMTILLYSDKISESHVMMKIRGTFPARDPMVSRLLYVANIAVEIKELQLLEHFTGSERIIMPGRDAKAKGHAYIQYSTQAEAREALEKFRQAPEQTGWFVIEAINQRKAEIGLLKDELRTYWLEQVKNLEAVDRTSKSSKDLSELDQKLMRYKKRIMADNTKRKEFGFVIADTEQYSIPDPPSKAEAGKGTAERSRDRSSHKKSGSRRRSRSRRRKTPTRFPRRFERGRAGPRPGGSSYVGGVRRTTQLPSNNEGGILVNQLQQLVGALSNNMSQQMSQNINRNFSNQSSYNNTNSSNYNSSSHYSNNYNSRSNFSEDRPRYGEVSSQRGRFGNYESERKRRYDDGDRYNSRYNQDYNRGYRGNGY